MDTEKVLQIIMNMEAALARVNGATGEAELRRVVDMQRLMLPMLTEELKKSVHVPDVDDYEYDIEESEYASQVVSHDYGD